MRTSALIPLLPFLVAGIATAHPHPHAHHGHGVAQHKQRKSLSYSPSHPHKTFETVDQASTFVDAQYDGDWKKVVRAFLGDKVGEGWYIRDDVGVSSSPCHIPIHNIFTTVSDSLLDYIPNRS
jgi:hypothetical protein